jgi:predicted ATPase/class 3 adenylate cyclase/Tfp pilus assembly protein PilF
VSSSKTLVLTDVVDSTQLNDSLGDAAMGALWRAHDEAARKLIVTWRGQEIARSDGFLVLFGSPADGASFALHYHRALRSLSTPLKARVGLHVGPVSLRENSEVDRLRGAPQFEIDGVSLPVVARVMATAGGGQTLLTASAASALGATSLRLQSHGHWRLKGVGEPMELFQVGDEESLFEPPPDSAKSYRVVRASGEWTPVRTIPNNLPAERDSFVGRAEALGVLERLLDGPGRQVTVLGIGGVGKTRLALRHARTWLGNYPGGAWFCDLSTARSLEGIFSAVSHALNVQLGKGDPVEQISASLVARGPCLIVLDNFEQVARHAEATLGQWLEHAPEAKFVATSREVLGIAGEQALVLAPLPVKEAEELFTRRAAAASNRFAPTSAERHDVAALVKLLEGLPLAIELAAARSRLMSPRMLLERMKERFTLLAARGGRHDRQMTLRSTLDWSWDLLSAAEKSALAQLSVFEGGFTLDAFEALYRFAGRALECAPIDLLQSLLDKSFVRQVGEDRFDLLQTVQEYASQHLHAEGRFEGSGPASAVAAEVRHGEFFAALTVDRVIESRCVELDNLVAACRRASGRGDHEVAMRALALAWAALELRGPFELGLELASRVLEMPELPNRSRAERIRGAALLAVGRVQDAQSFFNLALDAARDAEDRILEAEALSSLGTASEEAGMPEVARGQLTAALALARATKTAELECTVLNGLGSLNETLGRTDAARENYEAALTLARRIKSRRWEGGVLGNLASVQYAQGSIADACVSCEAALSIARQIGNKKWEANSLCNLGLMLQMQGKSEAAREHLESSLRLAREMGHARAEAISLCNLGITEEALSNYAGARAHLEAALGVAAKLADRRSQGQILGYLGLLHCKCSRFDDGRRFLDQGKEHLKAIANETDLAILLCQSAEGNALAKDYATARVELQEATALAEHSKAAEAFELKTALEHVRGLLAREATAMA